MKKKEVRHSVTHSRMQLKAKSALKPTHRRLYFLFFRRFRHPSRSKTSLISCLSSRWSPIVFSPTKFHLSCRVFKCACVRQGRSRPIRVLNRLTLVLSELSHFVSTFVKSALPLENPMKQVCVFVQRPNLTEYSSFDLLAVQPTTEKLFHVSRVLTHAQM